MTLLRRFALGTFALGLVLLALGLVAACSGGESSPSTDDFESFDTSATHTPTVSATRTPTARPTATGTPEPPTPTPTPFAGDVAHIQLEAFGVDSLIEKIGVDSNNQLETPKDPHATGWYDIYDRPGWGGNAVFSAHVDYWPDIKGPFNRLDETQPGDRVHIVMADGTRYVYEVFRLVRYDVATIPMGDIIWPEDRPAGEEWITLITCGGTFVQTSSQGWGEYIHRDVVVARLIEAIPA
ncbi:MAG: class F sortase [Dehalococcoidia bacterium]|nr:class F sortase [Dehalococcoidia bacterium]